MLVSAVPYSDRAISFSTLRCGSWIDAAHQAAVAAFILGFSTLRCGSWIDALDLMNRLFPNAKCFSTLRCGSWIDAYGMYKVTLVAVQVSVPFDAGRGLMHELYSAARSGSSSFSTLRCGSWIDAWRARLLRRSGMTGFSTLRCGSWIDAL